MQHVELNLAPLEVAPGDAAPWWRTAGDPVLEKLLSDGLAHDPALACDARALNATEDRAAAHDRHLIVRLARVTGKQEVPEGPSELAYAHAALVNRRAAAMAEAYLAARLAQTRLAARQAAADPWRDNAEIARFRREAGLVSAIDGSLGGVMVDLDTQAVAHAQTDLAVAVAHLADETGLAQDTVLAALGEPGDVLPALAAPAEQPPRRAGLMALRQRQGLAVLHHKQTEAEARAALSVATAASREDIDSAGKAVVAAQALADNAARTLALAERGARDARQGYRAGTETFATLYVAEASAQAAREAQAGARRGLALALVRLWTAQGWGWTQADLAPQPPAPGALRCD